MANSGKVLVTGATGNIASGLIPALLAEEVQVRALVHNESKAQALRDQGAEVVVDDLESPTSLGSAVEGVGKIFLLTTNGPSSVKQASAVIQAAKQAGTPHIVRQGAFGPEKSRLIKQHEETVTELKASGVPYTVLRPTYFMQNTMMAAQTVASDGMMYMPFKDGKLGMIDVRDIVDVALKVLTTGGHEGQSYTLTGPESISFQQVAAGLSKALGKEVTYVDVPPQAAREAMLGMGMPEWITEGYIELMDGFSQNWADTTTPNVENITGHPARSYETFAKDFAKAFGGA